MNFLSSVKWQQMFACSRHTEKERLSAYKWWYDSTQRLIRYTRSELVEPGSACSCVSSSRLIRRNLKWDCHNGRLMIHLAVWLAPGVCGEGMCSDGGLVLPKRKLKSFFETSRKRRMSLIQIHSSSTINYHTLLMLRACHYHLSANTQLTTPWRF